MGAHTQRASLEGGGTWTGGCPQRDCSFPAGMGRALVAGSTWRRRSSSRRDGKHNIKLFFPKMEASVIPPPQVLEVWGEGVLWDPTVGPLCLYWAG